MKNIKVIIFEDNRSLRQVRYQIINGGDGFPCVGAFSRLEDRTKLGPDIATGGLLASFLLSFSFLQEKNISATEMDNDKEGIFFR